MKSTTSLSGSHLITYNRIFQHPISHGLQWRPLLSLLEKVGQIDQEANGNVKVTRNGQTLILHPHHTKDVAEMDEVMAVRHFLERSDKALPEGDDSSSPWLLVIDHHEARIFRTSVVGGVPQQILPHRPEDYFRHAQDSMEISRGQEKPDPNSFFEPVAEALQAAGQILIFGTGTGTSSEMDQFTAWLGSHHPELAKRVIGSLVVNERHLTDEQLLAKARECHAIAHKPEAVK